MPDVTVSIVNHENRDAVLASVEAILADTTRRSSLEVVVVDNASQDGSVAALRALVPEVRVIARQDRAGYGANHNRAVAESTGRHVLLLNDDARVRPGAVDTLVEALDAAPAAALACPAVLTPGGDREPTLWPRPSLRLDLLGALRPGRPPAAVEGAGIGWATGCALMIRRSAFVEVGGFDERFFMYSEEVDLATRLADAGRQLVSVPAAVVVHQGQVSTGLGSPARAVEMARSRRRYWDKHYGPIARRAARVVVGLQFTSLAVAAVLRRRAAAPLWLQAAGAFHDPPRAGLRERAESFNAHLA